jgi:hypothetical protein
MPLVRHVIWHRSKQPVSERCPLSGTLYDTGASSQFREMPLVRHAMWHRSKQQPWNKKLKLALSILQANSWFLPYSTKTITSVEHAVRHKICPSRKNYAVDYTVLHGQEIFLFLQGSRLTLGTTHVPVQRVPGALSWVQGGWDVKLTSDIHLVSRAKIGDASPHCTHMPWLFA